MDSAFVDLSELPGAPHGHRQAAAAVGAFRLPKANDAAAVGTACRCLRGPALALEHIGIA